MTVIDELVEKDRRLTAFLDEQRLDGILLCRQANFAWATGGADNHVGIATDLGAAWLLCMAEGRKYLISDNIELGRLQDEELRGVTHVSESFQWFEGNPIAAVEKLAAGKAIGADYPTGSYRVVDKEFARLRYSLTPAEIERYRGVGVRVGEALEQTCAAAAPGQREHELAAGLAQRLLEHGVTPVVLLVAADERIARYRHPLPTDRPVEKCAMLVVCGRRWGLIVSATRLVHFGRPSADRIARHRAVAEVDATLIANTRPGRRVSDVFLQGVAAYERTGYPEEWHHHHQGGPTGYAGRDYRATAKTTEEVRPNQAFAWNPSIAGTKSEDTVIARPTGPEIISASPGFPMLAVEIDGVRWARPDLYVR